MTVPPMAADGLHLLIELLIKSTAVLSAAVLLCFLLRAKPASMRHFVLFVFLAGLPLLLVLRSVPIGWETRLLPSPAAAERSRPPVNERARSRQSVLPEKTAPVFESHESAPLPAFRPEDTFRSEGNGSGEPARPVETVGSQVVRKVLPRPADADSDSGVPAFSPGADSVASDATTVPRVSMSAIPRAIGFFFLVLWPAGLALLLLRLGAGLFGAFRLTREGETVRDPTWRMLLGRLLALLGMKRDVRLKSHGDVVVPLTWGLVRPVILIPAGHAGWTESRRSSVLLHELSHVKRADFVTMLLVRLSLAVFWFNPLAWLVLARLRKEQEKACDELVLRTGLRPSTYAASLLLFRADAGPRPASAASLPGLFGRSPLNDRLTAILRQKLTLEEVAMKTKIMLGIVSILAASAIGIARPQTAPPPPAKPAKATAAPAGVPAAPGCVTAPLPKPARPAATAPAGVAAPQPASPPSTAPVAEAAPPTNAALKAAPVSEAVPPTRAALMAAPASAPAPKLDRAQTAARVPAATPLPNPTRPTATAPAGVSAPQSVSRRSAAPAPVPTATLGAEVLPEAALAAAPEAPTAPAPVAAPASAQEPDREQEQTIVITTKDDRKDPIEIVVVGADEARTVTVDQTVILRRNDQGKLVLLSPEGKEIQILEGDTIRLRIKDGVVEAREGGGTWRTFEGGTLRIVTEKDRGKTVWSITEPKAGGETDKRIVFKDEDPAKGEIRIRIQPGAEAVWVVEPDKRVVAVGEGRSRISVVEEIKKSDVAAIGKSEEPILIVEKAKTAAAVGAPSKPTKPGVAVVTPEAEKTGVVVEKARPGVKTWVAAKPGAVRAEEPLSKIGVVGGVKGGVVGGVEGGVVGGVLGGSVGMDFDKVLAEIEALRGMVGKVKARELELAELEKAIDKIAAELKERDRRVIELRTPDAPRAYGVAGRTETPKAGVPAAVAETAPVRPVVIRTAPEGAFSVVIVSRAGEMNRERYQKILETIGKELPEGYEIGSDFEADYDENSGVLTLNVRGPAGPSRLTRDQIDRLAETLKAAIGKTD